jgi:hypothetical protein
MPSDADLVIVEYSINGYGGQCQCFTAPQNAGYETLVRKARLAGDGWAGPWAGGPWLQLPMPLLHGTAQGGYWEPSTAIAPLHEGMEPLQPQ